MLVQPRSGLDDPSSMPRIERALEPVTVDRAWLAAYRASVGLPDDGPERLPPLALQIAAAPLHLAILADRRFPFRAFGLIHVAQRVVQSEGLEPSSRLALSAHTTQGQRARRGMTFGLVTEARVDGRVAWSGETTVLAIARASGSEPPPRPGPRAQTDPNPVEQDTETDLRFEATVRAPEALGRRYAAIAGDLNPIHQHAWVARPFGFRRAIVHGTWTLAHALALAEVPVSSAYTLDGRFRGPVELPSDIAVRAYSGLDELRTRVVVSSPDGATVHLDALLVEA
jgi:acyl dehydratase